MPEQNDLALPLVSIIIRSMDRPTLSDAMDSVALLTYSNIEVIVINAKGAVHSELSEKCGPFPLRLIESDQQLSRSRAANVGLQTATGEYLIFLDDDDLFYPEHITTLVSALRNEKGFRCAYAGVCVEYYVNEQMETSTIYNETYDPRRLWGRNFIPIHAILFERSLVTSGCVFDENLEFFEDWDFWVQIAQHTAMLHVDKVGAVYRNFGYSGLGLEQDKNTIRELRGKFFKKWKTLLTGEQLDDLIQYREEIITDMRGLLARNETLITTLQNQKNRLTQEVHASTAREQALHQTINQLTQSTSWKTTAPLRFLSRIMHGQHREALAGLHRRATPLLRVIYWQIPAAWRSTVLTTAYRITGSFFAGTGHYEAWRANKKYSGHHFPIASHGFLAEMVDIQSFTLLKSKSPGRIAIHAHIFYPDLAPEFAKYLRNMPFSYDLFVSTPNESASKLCEQAFSNLPQLEQLTVTITPNRGRDIAPMFCTFGESLQTYDYIAHIHSKKSLYNNGATDGWRKYLLTCLLGSKTQISRIFTLLANENAGIVYPQNFSHLTYMASTWLSNLANGRIWRNKLDIKNFPTGYFDFPAGSMFWARASALHPLFEAEITIEDFPEETGQTDATLAHCLERLLVLVTKRSGFNAFILRDTHSNSWSRWRFDQYLARNQENVHTALLEPSVRIVIFDIFDTLLIRPLLNPESIKTIIAQKAGDTTGKIYLEFRATAETHARQKTGRDIGLDDIFKELASLSGLSSETITRLRHLEETVELEAVAPRPEAIALLQLATTLNKRVLLASDMYLPKSTVETMLWNNKITAWNQLYLSSDIGLRKDTGDLYHHILAQEQVIPNEIMVIGDNEHADIQIPQNLGMRTLHVLRPVELARAIPRFGPLIEQSLSQDQNSLNAQLTLGMLVRKNYQPLFYPHFDPSDLIPATPWSIGYTVVGPLVLSFIQWLVAKTSADGIQQLYFLAREGQILKMVYDKWVSNDAVTIASDYLILSRRTVAVPAISSFEDILEIARKRFFPNSLHMFVQERYGLTLSQQEYETLEKRKLWPKNKLVSVEDQKIDHLLPLLQELEGRILAQAQEERPALLAYMNDLGFNAAHSSAIVDIGYAATIQGRLNHLLNQTIHGYYLVTEERAQKVSSQYGVITQGCFGHHVDAFINPPLIFRKSFSLEQLLSSDDTQIIRYRIGDDGDILPEFRNITEKEQQAMTTRTEIRRGIMDFVDQSIAIRDKLADDFTVPPDLAKTLFETFIERPSHSEQAVLSKLMLDDYYCGRGLVN